MAKLLRTVLSFLVKRGTLQVTAADGTKFSVGDGTGPDLAIRFTNAGAQWRLLVNPEMTLGEAYMEGHLVVERGTIYELMMLSMANVGRLASNRPLKAVQAAKTLFRRRLQYNNARKSKHNVAHHYDLDGRLYALFLDSDRQYSCAYYEDPRDSLETAQLAKKRHIAAKLAIEPGQSILDIGCGWGGLALYLADYCEADVTGVTLSEEQLSVAKARVAERGLDQHVDLRLQDYRAIDTKFDRIVSVGMFEHVGVPHYDEYFAKVAELLDDDGVALIHTIGRTGQPSSTNPWISRYIFPGGYIPSLSEMMPAIERAGLIVADIEILRLHYAETLKAWRERFMARRDQARAIYDDRFCRMWEFYLAASEAAFRVGYMVNFQVQLVKRVDALPMTRDYMASRESELRLRDSGVADIRLAGE